MKKNKIDISFHSSGFDFSKFASPAFGYNKHYRQLDIHIWLFWWHIWIEFHKPFNFNNKL